MSYLVLARKWRPLLFKDVLGQEHVTRTLENAIKSDRLANAYLFSGPRGVGKTTIARILAKAINCEQGPTITPCNQCDSCHEIAESRNLDVFEIDGASNRGIDEIRNLRENLRYAPRKGKYKIYIIDEVHMLTSEAFNALLKTLEEPPENVLFIFATTEPHKVPATISSRCQRFTFKRLPIKKIIQQLKIICEAEQINIDSESMQTIAKKADGSMRDAESILDQAYSFAGNQIDNKNLLELLGLIDSEYLFKLSDCVKDSDVKGSLMLVESIFMEGYEVSEFLMNSIEHFRNLLVTKVTASADSLNVSETVAQRYLNDSTQFEEDDLLQYIKIASETETAIKRSSNPRLKFEFALLKMVKMESSVRLSQLFDRLDMLSAGLHSTAPVAPRASEMLHDNPAEVMPDRRQSLTIEDRKNEILTSLVHGENANALKSKKDDEVVQNQSTASIDIEIIQESWREIVSLVKKKKIALGVFIAEGIPTAIDENTLEITFGKDNNFHINTVAKNKHFLEKIITQVVGMSLRIRCVQGAGQARIKEEAVHAPGEDEEPVVENSETKEEPKHEKQPKSTVLDEIITIFDGEYVS